MPDPVRIVVPGDDPVQIAGSPDLKRLAPYGEVTLHDSRPDSHDEKIARAGDAEILINSRGVVTWRAAERRPRSEAATNCLR